MGYVRGVSELCVFIYGKNGGRETLIQRRCRANIGAGSPPLLPAQTEPKKPPCPGWRFTPPECEGFILVGVEQRDP